MWRRFSTNESWNRIVRSWLGKDIPSDEIGSLSGSIVSEAEAIAAFAELLENSLPGETPQIPNAVKATVAEAEAGTNDTKAVTPLGLIGAIDAHVSTNIEYGEIYTDSTGTAVVALSTSWAKVTGSWHHDTVSSDNVTPDYSEDKITVDLPGIYFVGVQASFEGSANAYFEGAIYADGARQNQTLFRRRMGATGDVGSASALGIINVTGSATDLELYAKADSGTPNFSMQAGQLWLYGLPIT